VARWPTSRRRLHPLKAHFCQLQCMDKLVDHANRVAIVNEIIIPALAYPRSACLTKRLISFPRRITRES